MIHNDDDDDDERDAQMTVYGTSRILVDERIRGSLSTLADAHHLETIFHRLDIVNDNPQPASAPPYSMTTTPPPRSTLAFAKFVVIVTQRLPSAKTPLLNAIVFWRHGALLRMLYQAVKASKLHGILTPRFLPSSLLHGRKWGWMLTCSRYRID